MELELQKFLRNGGTYDMLEEQGIKVRVSGDLALFKYAIEPDWSKPYTKECRGTILHKDTHEVIAYPFCKFWNAEESNAADINWSKAKICEKLDGSMMTYFYYDHMWRVASSGQPEASGDAHGSGITFNELFWKVVEENWYTMEHSHLSEYTFVFELTSIYNRVIIPYKDNKLTLLAVRNNKTLKEHNPGEFAHYFGTGIPAIYSLSNIDEIRETFDDMGGLDGEGYVVVDDEFNRIKIKNPAYVSLHHTKSKLGNKWIVETILNDETTEVLAYFPEFKERFDEVSVKYEELAAKINSEYDSIKHIESRKMFAARAKDLSVPGALFALYSGKVNNIKEYLRGITLKSACRLLGVSNVEEQDG